VEISVDGKKKSVFSINTGVPHLVVEGEPDFALAQKLRRAPELGPAGSNVTFVDRDHEEAEQLQAITFERGVENFTLACGTGAVAAAEFQRASHPAQTEVWIEMPGGALRVRWEDSRPLLSGPVELQFEAHFFEEFL
jgi:diaminopimelate epimerase